MSFKNAITIWYHFHSCTCSAYTITVAFDTEQCHCPLANTSKLHFDVCNRGEMYIEYLKQPLIQTSLDISINKDVWCLDS